MNFLAPLGLTPPKLAERDERERRATAQRAFEYTFAERW
jgi:hypothetical protein